MYLDLGGVSTGQKQFTGGTDINNDAKAREVSAQTTTDYIEYDILDEYDIDFKWVAGVFLWVIYVSIEFNSRCILANQFKVVTHFV